MKRIIYILSAFSLLVSCNFLNVDPKENVPEKELFKTKEGNYAALMDCYMGLASQTLYGKSLTMTDIETMANQWNEPSSVNQAKQLELYKHNYRDNQVREKIINAWYKAFFNIIVKTNNILKYDAASIHDTEERAIFLGEVHAIRAFCYFELFRLFGPVPGKIADQPMIYSETVGYKPVYKQIPAGEYIKMIKEEFKKAQALLSENDPVAKKYTLIQMNNVGNAGYEDVKEDNNFLLSRQLRFNYWAVRAMQARMALYLGNTEEAYATAKEIIDAKASNGKPVVELSTATDAAENCFASPSESIFLLSVKDMASVSKIDLGGSKDAFVNSTTMYWQKEDVVKDRIFEGVNLTDDIRFKNLWELESKDITGTKYPTLRKYYYSANKDEALSNKVKQKQSIVPVIRLSEIYLMAIETTSDLNEANSLYKAFMKSKNVILTSDHYMSLSDIKQKIGKEYLREFYAEGVMFYYYKRNDAKKFLLNELEVKEEHYVLPNPEIEVKNTAGSSNSTETPKNN